MNRLIFLLTALIAIPTFAFSQSKDLNFADRSSVSTALSQFGHKGITVTAGTKTPQDDADDGPGWYISALGKKGNQTWVARLWVSKDWKKGRVISCNKRD